VAQVDAGREDGTQGGLMWRVVSGAERSDTACRQAARRGEQSEAMGLIRVRRDDPMPGVPACI